MTEVINWVKEHYQDIINIVAGMVAVASMIVKLTPSQKDDNFLAKVVAVLDYFSIFNPNGTKVVKEEKKED